MQYVNSRNSIHIWTIATIVSNCFTSLAGVAISTSIPIEPVSLVSDLVKFVLHQQLWQDTIIKY